MSCPHCGTEIPAGATLCPSCGQPNALPYSGTGERAIPATGRTLSTSGKAVASLVFGILPLSVFSSIPAIVLGHIALSDIKKSAGRLQGHGMAIAGLALGYLGVVLVPFILIIAAIAIPNLLRARMAANEASAVRSIRSINAAEVNYSLAHSGGFTCSLSDLGDSIDRQLAEGQQHGYIFELSGCPAGIKAGYRITARPVTPGQTGARAFCADEGGPIRFDTEGSLDKCLSDGTPL